jgi:hypothetical protein
MPVLSFWFVVALHVAWVTFAWVYFLLEPCFLLAELWVEVGVHEVRKIPERDGMVWAGVYVVCTSPIKI